ncbi:MAG: hypothetical protein JNL58_07700 [Planctomyces sp.]|nr:hypothetical protein [Planctomyces sp.]
MTQKVVFKLSRYATLFRVMSYSMGVAAYAYLVVLFGVKTDDSWFTNIPSDVHAALTLVLGWLLVFRTNTSYSRWWEARTLWGSLINTSRVLAVKMSGLVRVPAADLEFSRKLIVAFGWCLRDHLRQGAKLQRLPGFEKEKVSPIHAPSWLVERMYHQMRSWKAAGIIDGDEMRALDEEVRRFLDICGGCERIRNTRLARSYRLFARQCVFLYLITLPWGIAQEFIWWTIPLTAILSYFMLGLETVAEHVEEPFGHDEDDLDLDILCRNIDESVTEILQTAENERKAMAI